MGDRLAHAFRDAGRRAARDKDAGLDRIDDARAEGSEKKASRIDRPDLASLGASRRAAGDILIKHAGCCW